jgi:hypothetical protein
MKHEWITELSASELGRHFLTRSYSLELLLLLFERDQIDGIEQLYAMIQSKKSKMPAFLGFLNYLEDRNCIIKFTNEDKRSQRVIALTNACREEVRQIFSGTAKVKESEGPFYGSQLSNSHTINP